MKKENMYGLIQKEQSNWEVSEEQSIELHGDGVAYAALAWMAATLA